MGSNFTVVQSQRQHFGNQPGSFNDIEPDVPFVGAAKEFIFDCPHINPEVAALLLFQSRDVTHSRNVLHVNGAPVSGGLPVSPSRDSWNGNVLLVEPQHRLRETGNVLRIEARNTGGGMTGDIDDFIIDNLVIQYKTLELSDPGLFNVRSYGAKGEGSPSDFLRILAARDALNAAGGGVLLFPRGTYAVYDTIELGSNTTVLGSGAGTVLEARVKDPSGPCFNMLSVRKANNVCVRDLVLDGNAARTTAPAEGEENLGCGLLGFPVREARIGLSIRDVVIRNHHRAGIRIAGAPGGDDAGTVTPNEVEVIGCRIDDCGSRGVMLSRATRGRIVGNVITSCTQAGIQLTVSRGVVIDGNTVQKIIRRDNTNSGHGIAVANSFDYVIANNMASENARWGIVASGGIGLSPDDGVAMSQRYVVQNNICRGNAAGGITLDPSTTDDDGKPTGLIHDSFATVASNVCTANTGHGIQTIHTGYVAVRGNICDGNDNDGIAIVSSRYAVVADNVLTGNHNGVGFYGDPADVPRDTPEMGHHLLGGNLFERNTADAIRIGERHPAIQQLISGPAPTPAAESARNTRRGPSGQGD